MELTSQSLLIQNKKTNAKIYRAKVAHKRTFPKVNQFNYPAFYLALPLSEISSGNLHAYLNINKKSLISFFEADHGPLDGSNLEVWLRNILKKHQLNELVDEIVLISIPRFLNYVFNPVSFWMCLDKEKNLRAVLCEVNNTFGETHSYLCAHHDNRIIQPTDYLVAQKVFYVSPFLERQGYYQFKFYFQNNQATFRIDFYNKNSKKQLITTLSGELTELSKSELNKQFWRFPHFSLKVMLLIHWQALRLFFKKVKHIVKPKPKAIKLTKTQSNR